MMAASIAALVFLANPASAAEGQHARTVLKRLTVAADPMTEAFGARVVMPLDVKNASRWADVLRRQEASLATPAACADPAADQCFASFWAETIAELKTLPRDAQVRRVNDVVNQLGYWSDRDVYRKADYWATPEEMFEKMGGDCEDFALFKYFLLRAAPPAELSQYQAVYSLSETGAWFLAAADQPAGVQTALAEQSR